ncbi:MAG: Hsp20/alpha crystallin family protein [Syntrophomonadaceae bacterium]|nr:Hsp20/alpha crystallin family protein [Syntrophomonadaceae bacterium]
MSKDNKLEIDFGIGKISLGGLQKWVELASELENKKEVRKAGEIKGLSKNIQGVYGISIKTLADKSKLDTLEKFTRTEKAPLAQELRETPVDIFDEDDMVVVIAEIPGVSEQEISIQVIENRLELTVLGREKQYSRNFMLPSKVIPSSMKTSYNNGVLEIILQKDQERNGL